MHKTNINAFLRNLPAGGILAAITTVFLAAFLVPGVVAPFPPPFVPLTITDPTNPGAHCVNKTAMNHSAFPNNCYDYLAYEMVYMDAYQDLRVAYGKYVSAFTSLVGRSANNYNYL